jgi:protein arginine kinase
MKFADLSKQPSEWLKGAGSCCDVVISSRVRLARNLVGFPFLSRASEPQKQQIQDSLRRSLDALGQKTDSWYVRVDKESDLDRQLLVERHLISKQMAEGQGGRGVEISTAETWAIMVNEEDHLRLQALRSGLELDAAWEEARSLDDALDGHIAFAYSSRLGYLTACPTNVGTGMRASVMLHLPALRISGEIDRVARAAKDMHLMVRGIYGEGTEATGDFYQISNQTTLGKTEEQIIREFKTQVIPKIVDYEQQARRALMRDRSSSLEDKIWRSLATLTHARMLSIDETMTCLSHVRMGRHLKLLGEPEIPVINELLLQMQPAHLQQLVGRDLADDEEQQTVRAERIRRRLGAG